MDKRPRRIVPIAVSFVLACSVLAAQDAKDVIALPKPQMEGGKPLMQALKDRQTGRDFDTAPLPDPVLSNLLWAAWGINRPESGKRTAPSARNKQEITLYVVNADGVYVYEEKEHQLRRVATGDLRADTGVRDAMAAAPIQLLYVADFSKSAGGTPDDKLRYAAVTVGCIIQNVYLFCASEGLSTVTRASDMDAPVVEALQLGNDRHVIMAQTVGYPAK